MITVLRKFLWLVLFAALTFGFVVLFEHGPQDYPNNARAEWKRLQKVALELWKKKGF